MDLLGGGIAGGGNEETLERERERQIAEQIKKKRLKTALEKEGD